MGLVFNIGHSHTNGTAANAAGQSNSVVIGAHVGCSFGIHSELVHLSCHIAHQGQGVAGQAIHRVRGIDGRTGISACTCCHTGLTDMHQCFAQSVNIGIMGIQSIAHTVCILAHNAGLGGAT